MADPGEDLQVLQACLSGGPEERDAFARHFAPLVSGIVRDADLAQEVFLALFENDCRRLRQFDPAKGNAGAWIALIARQVASKRAERPSGPPLPERLEAPERPPSLKEALLNLPPREGLCLALLYDQGLTGREAAAILGVSRQTLYDIRERALEKLRKSAGSP